MTTMSALITQASARFRDTSNDVIGTPQWCQYINAAYRHINRSTPLWPWLESSVQTITVTAGTRSAALPGDTVQVNSVYDNTDNKPLFPVEGKGAQFQGDIKRDTTGIPRSYRLRSTTIEIFPLSQTDTVLCVECVLFPGSLDNADEPVFPEPFHEILLEGALAYAYMDDGNADWHNLHWSKFTDELATMKATILAFRTESYPVIPDAFNY